MERFSADGLLFVKVGPLGPFANNAYVIADENTREAVVVDAPQESERVLSALEGLSLRRIVVTHRHGDHWSGLDALLQHAAAPVFCHEADRVPYAARVAGTLADGEEIAVGGLRVRVLHTPGHTPGSICLVVGGHVVSGDTLFSGGPGRTQKPEDLRQVIDAIKRRLYVLPDTHRVHPGHGESTTIGASKAEYAIFAAREHSPDLCGDVTWSGA